MRPFHQRRMVQLQNVRRTHRHMHMQMAGKDDEFEGSEEELDEQVGELDEALAEQIAAIDEVAAERKAETLRAGLSEYDLDDEDLELLAEADAGDEVVIARPALPVLAIPAVTGPAEGLTSGGLLVVAVSEAHAVALAEASVTAVLSVALSG